jgi:hypothetical protein
MSCFEIYTYISHISHDCVCLTTGHIPSEGRQTLLFSATMTRSITAIQEISTRPVFAFESKSDAEFELVEQLEQFYVFMPAAVKECYLLHILRTLLNDADDDDASAAAQERDDADDDEDTAVSRKRRKREGSKSDRKKTAADAEIPAGKKPKSTFLRVLDFEKGFVARVVRSPRYVYVWIIPTTHRNVHCIYLYLQ